MERPISTLIRSISSAMLGDTYVAVPLCRDFLVNLWPNRRHAWLELSTGGESPEQNFKPTRKRPSTQPAAMTSASSAAQKVEACANLFPVSIDIPKGGFMCIADRMPGVRPALKE